MKLPEIGEVITPVDDPCQFNPAWRSIVAGYLFSAGVKNDNDLNTLSKTGCIIVRQIGEVEDAAAVKKGKKGGKGKPKKKKVEVKVSRPLYPFYQVMEYRQFASDKWISLHLAMCNEEGGGNGFSDACVPVRLASRWYMEIDHEASMKKRLEPLLLTEADLDTVTLDITGLASLRPAVEAYEKLYFNCRDENFNLSQSMQLITRMAMPWGPLKMYLKKWEDLEDGFCVQDGRPIAKESDVWRAIAATMGYDALIYHWRWDKRAHGLKESSPRNMLEMSWKAAISNLFYNLFTGDMKHEDAARILASLTAHSKFLSEDRKEGVDGEDTTIALMAVLKAAAPKMRVLEAGGAGMITDNEIQSRIAAQQAIDKQSIHDAGKQVSDQIIDAQIANAIEG